MSVIPDRLYHMGGVPVGSGGENPIFGEVWFVDGTNGSTSGDGSPGYPFSTVQLAVTKQIAGTSGLGDVIYIMPGTYSEAVIASVFNKAQLIGATCGGEPKAVIIHNSAGHAFVAGADATYTTTMNNSALRNITFYSPGSSNREYAAVRIDTIQNSVIDNCKYLGNYQDSSANITTVGLQLGPLTGTYNSFHEHCTISNNWFGTSGARAKEVDTALRVGADSVTTPAGTGFSDMLIVNNKIIAEHYGIRLHVGASSCGGSLIGGNTFHSHQGGGGVNVAIKTHAASTDLLMMIHENRGNCHTAFASGFPTKNQVGNLISVTDANAVGLYPPAS